MWRIEACFCCGVDTTSTRLSHAPGVGWSWTCPTAVFKTCWHQDVLLYERTGYSNMSQFDFVHRTEGFEPCSAGSTIENQLAGGIVVGSSLFLGKILSNCYVMFIIYCAQTYYHQTDAVLRLQPFVLALRIMGKYVSTTDTSGID